MGRIRAILCDLDGTLVDSAEDLRDALNALLAEHHLSPLTLAEVKAMIGDGIPKLVERGLQARGAALPDGADAVARFRELYAPRAAKTTRPYPGVVETLGRLAAQGLRLAVVTNKPERETLQILGSLGLADRFGAVIGGDTLPERKPHPAPLLEAMRRLNVAAPETAMVGDNHHDVEAARAAGAAAILVAYGYSRQPVAKLDADIIIDRFTELEAALLRLEGRT